MHAPPQASVPAMADTGCQSCLAGLKVIHRLGFNENQIYYQSPTASENPTPPPAVEKHVAAPEVLPTP
ncbi:hypothetical protein DPMN_017362 [Dreissena polymorpha]|uniref:Uncharacterized protein n=1 Tax=Dreissena polymorpha TaxID=45954 RepID=A0A9D4S5D1_DREPO|nr:hypothetical protein DPMN_017362 [Dreissena polymorpha]